MDSVCHYFRPGCGMPEVWDIEDSENRDKDPSCQKLKKIAEPYFKRVFKNNIYQVLKVVSEPKLS